MQPFKLVGADGDSGHGSNLILFQSRKNFQKPVIVDLEISGGHGSIDIASVKRVFKTSHAGVKCAGLVEIGVGLGGVEFDQRLASADLLTVAHQDAAHAA